MSEPTLTFKKNVIIDKNENIKNKNSYILEKM